MTNTSETTFIVTACLDHGTKECSDYASARVYVQAARECDMLANAFPLSHAVCHNDDMDECWSCCRNMVVDPHGVFDY